MAERERLFNLNPLRFEETVDQHKWFNLQDEFKTRGVSLSQSLLIWEEESRSAWLLTDLENKKTYDIQLAEDSDQQPTMMVWEQSSEVEQPFALTDTEAILSRLQSAQGTDQGFIDFLKRINLDELDLEGLKRSNLSEAGFSFESVHQDLSTVHSMLREILTAPREWLLNISRMVVHSLNRYLPQFYENVRNIENFQISNENPRETHDNLLQNISNSCGSVKEPLGHIVAYLSSRKVEQLAIEINDTVTAAVDRLETETNRAEEINNEAEKKQAAIQQEFDRLKIEVENKLAEKPISQYKTIFADQAKEHYKGARNWLKMAGGTTVLFFAAFVGLTIWLGSEDSGLTGTLRNLFTKGFLLSPIYVWLNRSIKNYTAQKHLEVINIHRQNALETFDTFVAAAGDNRETRDAVLLSATDAIFDANQTGYLSAKGSGSDSSKGPVQQVIREFISDKSSFKKLEESAVGIRPHLCNTEVKSR